MAIVFHTEDIKFKITEPTKIKAWLKNVVKEEGWKLGELNYIFCSDDYLYQMNVQHLQHDTLTDVITFQYSEEKVQGDIFISVERTNENAQTYQVSPMYELQRVMVHGLLHLMGYGDKSPDEKAEMTAMEDKYLKMM